MILCLKKFACDSSELNLIQYILWGGVGDPQVIIAAQKIMEDVATSVYQIPRVRLASVPVGTTWLMQTNVLRLSSALCLHSLVRMVRNAFPWSKFAMVIVTVLMDLMKWTVSTAYLIMHIGSFGTRLHFV